MDIFNFYSIYSTFETYTDWQANPTITTIDTTAYPIKNVEFLIINAQNLQLGKTSYYELL